MATRHVGIYQLDSFEGCFGKGDELRFDSKDWTMVMPDIGATTPLLIMSKKRWKKRSRALIR